jgi:hypothetical protein
MGKAAKIARIGAWGKHLMRDIRHHIKEPSVGIVNKNEP